jgi:hypothetical protein
VPENQQHPKNAGKARRDCHHLIRAGIEREENDTHASILREFWPRRIKKKAKVASDLNRLWSTSLSKTRRERLYLPG